MLDRDADSRQIFFLHPHHFAEESIIPALYREEYEVFTLKDHSLVVRLLSFFNNPILFVNIDHPLHGETWQEFIALLNKNQDKTTIEPYAISREDPKTLAKPEDLGCNLITLQHGSEASFRVISMLLKKGDALGKRKFVRAHCQDIHHASFSIKRGESILQGRIADISTNGMACVLNEQAHIPLHTYINDLQIRLDGLVMNIAGTVSASRKGSSPVYVVIFDQKRCAEYKEKIQHFIYGAQQRELAEMIKNIDEITS